MGSGRAEVRSRLRGWTVVVASGCDRAPCVKRWVPACAGRAVAGGGRGRGRLAHPGAAQGGESLAISGQGLRPRMGVLVVQDQGAGLAGQARRGRRAAGVAAAASVPSGRAPPRRTRGVTSRLSGPWPGPGGGAPDAVGVEMAQRQIPSFDRGTSRCHSAGEPWQRGSGHRTGRGYGAAAPDPAAARWWIR